MTSASDTDEWALQVGKWLAVGAFLIGSVLLALFSIGALFHLESFCLVAFMSGMIFVPCAIIANLFVLFLVLVVALGNAMKRCKALLTAMAMLLNLPIAWFYLDIVFLFE